MVKKIYQAFALKAVIICMLFFSLINLAIVYINVPGPLKKPATIIFPYGSNTHMIVEKLYENRVIRFPWFFKTLIRVYGIKSKPKSGEYIFTPYITPMQTLKVLTKGRSVIHRLLIPEGYTVKQIINLLYNEPLLSGSINSDLKEGFLFPSTYIFTYNDQRQKLIDQMRRNMSMILDEITEDYEFNKYIVSRVDIINLASIVQKEALYPHEKPVIAGLYFNRLAKNMRLQADPTVIYGLSEGLGKIERPLLRRDLLVPSPYNTYLNYGLPPTPICCPGRNALKAVISPFKSKYLYMVTKGDGTHYFAENYPQHLANIAKFKKFREAQN